jgi:hypothetical protein
MGFSPAFGYLLQLCPIYQFTTLPPLVSLLYISLHTGCQAALSLFLLAAGLYPVLYPIVSFPKNSTSFTSYVVQIISIRFPWILQSLQFSLCCALTEHYAMKAYWGSGGIAPHIIGPGTSLLPQIILGKLQTMS